MIKVDLRDVLHYWYPDVSIAEMQKIHDFYSEYWVDIMAIVHLEMARGKDKYDAMDKARREFPVYRDKVDVSYKNTSMGALLSKNYFGNTRGSK